MCCCVPTVIGFPASQFGHQRCILNEPPVTPGVEVHAQPDGMIRIMEPLLRNKGWIKFVAIVTIIGGVFTVLSIWGIIVAWLPIWAGVTLLQVCTQLEQNQFQEANEKLALAFRLWGILMMVYIGLIGLVFVLVFVGMLAGFSNM